MKYRLDISKYNIFFISDLHLFHDKIILYDRRPYDNIKQMHESFIENWNNVVNKNDYVFILGDLSFEENMEKVNSEVFSRLNGNKILVTGNHDSKTNLEKLRVSVHDYIELTVKDDKNYQKIILFHYPILVWNYHHRGAWHLHGHCHGNLLKNMPSMYKRKVMDVGTSCIHYTPISYREVEKYMEKKEIIKLDHHDFNKKES
jgi:calcineurin-like phosphoesterase family protein